jgi:hypothetical protein
VLAVISVGFGRSAGWALAAQPALQTTALNWRDQNSVAASRYSTIALSPEMHGSIQALKAANPRRKVLMYDNVTFSNSADCADTRNTAVSDCAAIANDPSWYRRDGGGQPMRACSPPGFSWTDVGNAGYRSAVADDAIARAKAFGFDGVFLHDVDTFPGHCETGGGLLGATPSYSDLEWNRKGHL